jgi:hypothetical protein
MKRYQAVLVDDSIEFKGTVEILHEYFEDKFESQFGFRPMFQESEDEGYLEMYLHTDTYEILGDKELELCRKEKDTI